jgi:hypothetical protein
VVVETGGFDTFKRSNLSLTQSVHEVYQARVDLQIAKALYGRPDVNAQHARAAE